MNNTLKNIDVRNVQTVARELKDAMRVPEEAAALTKILNFANDKELEKCIAELNRLCYAVLDMQNQ